MERPQHQLAAIAAQGKKNKTVSLGLVIGIHVVIIGGLIVGLSNDQLRKEVLDISASVVAKKEAPKELPPPPPAMVRPPPQAVAPPPQIVIQAAPPPPVVVPKAAPPPPPPPTELKEITRTHTLPPYPALSQRMGEQGTTSLSCEINVTGKPDSCKVEKSSGSARLDDAASSYVKDHYTWQPPTQLGKPVAATAHLNVIWDLKNAQ
ncbi:MAG TPA: energy transducer TonB [Rhizomicrobium sp.]|jgi:protein TonB|nr:energy transducer TonB [Rhizomicrobium sp.]